MSSPSDSPTGLYRSPGPGRLPNPGHAATVSASDVPGPFTVDWDCCTVDRGGPSPVDKQSYAAELAQRHTNPLARQGDQ